MLPNAAPLTLRERRKQETRDHIRRTALALLEARGYDAMTVDLISAQAGVSVRTFFNYFASKELAMIAVPPALPEAAVLEFLSRTGPQALFDDLSTLVVSMFEAGPSAPTDFQSSISVVMGIPALARLQHGALLDREAQLAALIAARLSVSPDDAGPAVVAAACTGAIRVACQRWWSPRRDQPTFAAEVRLCLTVLTTATDLRPISA